MAAVTVPSNLSEEARKRWLDNTVKYGVPIYMDPFWFWPSSLKVEGTTCAFAAFKGSDHVEACLVWNDHKEPCTFCLWNDRVPLFVEDRSVLPATGPVTPGVPLPQPVYPGSVVEVEIGTAKIERAVPWGWFLMAAAVGGTVWYRNRKKR